MGPIVTWKVWRWTLIVLCMLVFASGWTGDLFAAAPAAPETAAFPPDLESYGNSQLDGIGAILVHRIRQEPFNLAATLIFFLAIVHTFLTGKFMVVAHRWHHQHQKRIEKGEAHQDSVHHGAELFHFLGAVEIEYRTGGALDF
jgi:hypothetical protein